MKWIVINDMLVVGVGARKGIDSAEAVDAISRALDEADCSMQDVRFLASAKLKENESGLLEAARILDIEIRFLPHELLNSYITPSPSQAQRFGLTGVAEPAALALSENKRLIFKKKVYGRITVAIAE